MKLFNLNKKKILYTKFYITFLFLSFNYLNLINQSKIKKKIGVISLAHSNNIGNILLY